MIRNRTELLNDISMECRKQRRILLSIVEHVIEKISPENLLKNKISQSYISKFKKILVIGIGKGAPGMVRAVLPALKTKQRMVLFADEGHPIPTKKGLKNTERIILATNSLCEKDLAIVLISGGGSAMLVSPAPEISLDDKTKTTRALLRSGATIQEMNIIRKHLSRIKGGNLAKLLYPATVLGFVMSDVVGNDLSSVSSGPLSPDPSTFADAIKIIKKYRIKLPAAVKKYLEKGTKNPDLETPKPNSKYFEKVNLRIIADHCTVLKTAFEKAKKLGLKARKIAKPLTGEARKIAKSFVRSCHPRLYRGSINFRFRGNDIFIATGETTITCKGNGYGGRNQEFVLSALRYIRPNQTVLSIGTDGVDGICPKKIAGAIGDIETLKKAQKLNLDINDFLKRNDSYSFFKQTNGLVKTGATGSNLGDLIMILS